MTTSEVNTALIDYFINEIIEASQSDPKKLATLLSRKYQEDKSDFIEFLSTLISGWKNINSLAQKAILNQVLAILEKKTKINWYKFTDIPNKIISKLDTDDWKVWLCISKLTNHQPEWFIDELTNYVTLEQDPYLAQNTLYYLQDVKIIPSLLGELLILALSVENNKVEYLLPLAQTLEHQLIALPSVILCEKVANNTISAPMELIERFSTLKIFAKLQLINDDLSKPDFTNQGLEKNIEELNLLFPKLILINKNNLNLPFELPLFVDYLETYIDHIFHKIILTPNIDYLTPKLILNYLGFISHTNLDIKKNELILQLIKKVSSLNSDSDTKTITKALLTSAIFFRKISGIQIDDETNDLSINDFQPQQDSDCLLQAINKIFKPHQVIDCDLNLEEANIEKLISISFVWQTLAPFIFIKLIDVSIMKRKQSETINLFFQAFPILKQLRHPLFIYEINLYFSIEELAKADKRFNDEHRQYLQRGTSLKYFNDAKLILQQNNRIKSLHATMELCFLELKKEEEDEERLVLAFINLIAIFISLANVLPGENDITLESAYRKVPNLIEDNLKVFKQINQQAHGLKTEVMQYCQHACRILIKSILQRKNELYLIDSAIYIKITLLLHLQLQINPEITSLEDIIANYNISSVDKHHALGLNLLVEHYLKFLSTSSKPKFELISHLIQLHHTILANDQIRSLYDLNIKLNELLLRVVNHSLSEININHIDDIIKNKKFFEKHLDRYKEILSYFSLNYPEGQYSISLGETHFISRSIEVYSALPLGLNKLSEILTTSKNELIKKMGEILALNSEIQTIPNNINNKLQNYENFTAQFKAKNIALYKILSSMILFVREFIAETENDLLKKSVDQQWYLFRESLTYHSSIPLTLFSQLNQDIQFNFINQHQFKFLNNETIQEFVFDDLTYRCKEACNTIMTISAENISVLHLLSDAILQLPLQKRREKISTFIALDKNLSTYKNKNIIDVMKFFELHYDISSFNLSAKYGDIREFALEQTSIRQSIFKPFENCGIDSPQFIQVITQYYLNKITEAVESRKRQLHPNKAQRTLTQMWLPTEKKRKFDKDEQELNDNNNQAGNSTSGNNMK